MADTTPLTPAQISDLLKASTAALRSEVAAAPAEALAWHPAAGEWCAKEVLGHLIEADRRGFAGRVEELRNGATALSAWDQRQVAHARRDCERDADGLIAELLAERERGLPALLQLTPADLARSGRHPKVGDLSIGDVIHEWVHHDRNHLRQLLANIQAYVWPHMGAARRFSDG